MMLWDLSPLATANGKSRVYLSNLCETGGILGGCLVFLGTKKCHPRPQGFRILHEPKGPLTPLTGPNLRKALGSEPDILAETSRQRRPGVEIA